MGVPVSKLKSSSQSVTLIVEKGRKSIASKAATTSTLEQDALCDNVRLIESRIAEDGEKSDQPQHSFKETATLSEPNFQTDAVDQTTGDENEDGNKEAEAASPEQGQSMCQQLKYIDDNEASSENGSFRKEADEQNDNDSGNASISSDNSHHEDGFEEFEASDEVDGVVDPLGPIRLRRRTPQGPSSAFNFYSTLTNRLSTTSFVKRYTAQNVLSQFEQSSLRKLISKLQPGDLIEMRCLCNCLKGGQLRASLNHRQRFRRTLQRQSFHQMPAMHTLQSMTSNGSSGNNPKRSSISNLTSVFRRSCISGSMSELPAAVNSTDSKHLLHQAPSAPNAEHQQCTEQFHYVLVHKVEEQGEAAKSGESESSPPIDQTSSVWCFHVRPYQRVALLEDDRHLGVIKHESLDTIVGQFLGEMEERHWQFGRGFKQPKLSVFYQIRNQEKLSQSILKQTLNERPDVGRMVELLMDLRDSYVRYHRTLCNSEHYATLWKYGIGWSTWANGRGDILRSLQHFLQSFSQVSPGSGGVRIQLQGGECLVEQTTNLVHVHCFGLKGSRLEESIRQWIRSQVVIQSRGAPDIVLPPLDESYLQQGKAPADDLQSSDTLPMDSKESEQQQHQSQQLLQPVDYKSSSPSTSTSLEDFHQADKETALAVSVDHSHEEEEVVTAVAGTMDDDADGKEDATAVDAAAAAAEESCTDSAAIVCADKSSLSPAAEPVAAIMEQSTARPASPLPPMHLSADH